MKEIIISFLLACLWAAAIVGMVAAMYWIMEKNYGMYVLGGVVFSMLWLLVYAVRNLK